MKLIYIYDALCGWCFGFSPVLDKFYKRYSGELEFKVISGGMITGNRIGPIGEVAGYIKDAYKQVENATGVTFGANFLEGILEKGTAEFTSVPASMALCIFKELFPEKQLQFAARLQKAIYFDGIAPLDQKAYGKLAGEFGLNEKEFTLKLNDPNYLTKAEEEFAFSQQIGVTGFPTVILQEGEKAGIIARGYVSYNDFEKNYLHAKEAFTNANEKQ